MDTYVGYETTLRLSQARVVESGEKKKMKTIAIDIDGTIAELIVEWLARYNKDYNDNLKKEDIKGWDTAQFVKPECGNKIYRYIEDPSIYDDVKPIEGALEKIKLLKEFYRVIFVTTSTLGAAGRKFLWLKEHKFIKDLNDYIECKDKTLVRAQYLIDDKIDNVKAFTESGGVGILFNEPWNEKEEWTNRLKNWNTLSYSWFSGNYIW